MQLASYVYLYLCFIIRFFIELHTNYLYISLQVLATLPQLRQCLSMTTVLVECGIANEFPISFPISYLNISMMIIKMNSKNLETDYI